METEHELHELCKTYIKAVLDTCKQPFRPGQALHTGLLLGIVPANNTHGVAGYCLHNFGESFDGLAEGSFVSAAELGAEYEHDAVTATSEAGHNEMMAQYDRIIASLRASQDATTGGSPVSEFTYPASCEPATPAPAETPAVAKISRPRRPAPAQQPASRMIQPYYPRPAESEDAELEL